MIREIVKIDEDKCNGCGLCVPTCNVKAITLAKSVAPNGKAAQLAVVDSGVCLGCGACISACKRGALAMVTADNRERTPQKRSGLLATTAKSMRADLKPSAERSAARPAIAGLSSTSRPWARCP